MDFKFALLKLWRNDQKNGMPETKKKLKDELSLSNVDGLTIIQEFISQLKHIPSILPSDIIFLVDLKGTN